MTALQQDHGRERIAQNLVRAVRGGRRDKKSYGIESALAYLVGEKLINFAEAAEQRPEFAHELRAFAEEVRRLFSLHEL